MNPYYDTGKDIRGRLGMVVPVYYPDDVPDEGAAALLGQTLADVELYCAPQHVALVVDGPQRLVRPAEEAARRLARGGCGPHVVAKPANEGKGAAVRTGLERLLSEAACEAFVVRDCDGDHYLNDVPSLFRLLHQMRRECGSDCVLVIGARADRRRPMGLVRGEMELWMADVFWHAVQYALAVQGRAVNAAFLGPYGHLPDVLSGFKMFSRPAAAAAVEGLARATAEHPDLDMGRYGAEIVSAVEVLLAGGALGQMIRGTLEGQPCSGFARFDPMKMYPSRLLWLARRLGLPPAVAVRLFDNACARSVLSADEVFARQFAEMRRRLAEGVGAEAGPPARSAFC